METKKKSMKICPKILTFEMPLVRIIIFMDIRNTEFNFYMTQLEIFRENFHKLKKL